MVQSEYNTVQGINAAHKLRVCIGITAFLLLMAGLIAQYHTHVLGREIAKCLMIQRSVESLSQQADGTGSTQFNQHLERSRKVLDVAISAYPWAFNGISRTVEPFLSQIAERGSAGWATTNALFTTIRTTVTKLHHAERRAREAGDAMLISSVSLTLMSSLFRGRKLRNRMRFDRRKPASDTGFEPFIDLLPEPVVLFRADRVIGINPAAQLLLGYSSAQEALGRQHSEIFLVPEPGCSSLSCLIPTESDVQQRSAVRSWYCRRSNGSKIPVHVTLSYLTCGADSNLIAVIHDLTDERRVQDTVRANERRLVDMIDNLPVGTVLVEGEKITPNRMVEEFTGYSRDELTSLTAWFKLMYREEADHIRAAYESNRLRGFTSAQIRTIERKDGTRRIIQFSALTYDESEVWILQDVSERIEAEQAAERLSAILEATPDYIGSSTIDGRIFYSNKAFQALWDSAGLVPQTIQQCVPAETYRILRRNAMPTAARLGLWQGEGALVASHGKEIPVSAVVIAHRDANGKVLYYSTIARDISARLQTENRLRSSEALLAEAQQVAHMGSYEYNYATRQLIWSEEVYRLFDRDPSLGPPSVDEIMEYYHPDDAAALKNARKEALKTNGTYEYDIRIRQRNGVYRWCHTITRATSDEFGKPLRIVGTLIDITATKCAQEQAHSTNLWLEETNKQLIEQQATVLQMHQRMEEQVRVVNEQALLLEQQKQELEKMNGMLQALATTDGLTGIANHRAFQERLADEWQRSERYKSPFSVILLDVDKFKTYNDEYGHPEGDTVLKMVAHTLKLVMRDVDLVARYGGEEFVILLPETGPQGARDAAERCRVAIESNSWPKRPVTASFGVSTTGFAVTTAQELIDNADKALYVSKDNGRNRVTHYENICEYDPKALNP